LFDSFQLIKTWYIIIVLQGYTKLSILYLKYLTFKVHY